MPRLWNDTIQEHRREVRAAILETTWTLVTKHGLRSVTMSQIAEETGIGRATLYKYFPDVDAILLARHRQTIDGYLEHLVALRDKPGEPTRRLASVLHGYAALVHRWGHSGVELGALLHPGQDIAVAQRRIVDLIRDLLTELARAGRIRSDVAPAELATYCLHALTAASALPSQAAVRRLVTVTLAGLRAAG